MRFSAEQVVVMLGKAVGFVADELEQSQAEGMPAEAVGLGLAREEDFLFLFGQRNGEWWLDLQQGEGLHYCI